MSLNKLRFPESGIRQTVFWWNVDSIYTETITGNGIHYKQIAPCSDWCRCLPDCGQWIPSIWRIVRGFLNVFAPDDQRTEDKKDAVRLSTKYCLSHHYAHVSGCLIDGSTDICIASATVLKRFEWMAACFRSDECVCIYEYIKTKQIYDLAIASSIHRHRSNRPMFYDLSKLWISGCSPNIGCFDPFLDWLDLLREPSSIFPYFLRN